jgi:V/A-type H+-transporting ATPase subunit I
MDELLEMEEFIVNRNGMGDVNDFAYIEGYIPADDEQKIKEASLVHGWAIQTEDADPEDSSVPTKLTIPRWADVTKPLFKFLGISPSYAENDVSVSVLFFLGLFFAMLIGDAGYGIIFLVLALYGRRKIKSREQQLPINLFIFFSAITTVWGWLSGNFFGIENSTLPSFMQGLEWFTGGGGESHVKWFCFLIAAIHLSMARVWKAILLKKFPIKVAANIGWAIFIWGNFYMACNLLLGDTFPVFAKWLYIIGGTIVVFTDINFLDVGSVINAPFAFINSFVDVLSYIRLFAVGFASLKIAESFNAMAASSFESGGFGVLMAIVIVGLGHLLNIILGFMAVLVHGVRLNTLEFSNHMGITWGGLFFSPFKKKKSTAVSVDVS